MHALPARLARRCTLVAACLFAVAAFAAESAAPQKWIPLFNGKNLDGWTVKIARHPIGENFGETFRVEDGIIKVAYDNYQRFDQKFGHLYTNSAYSHYILRLEYLITGKVMPDAPSWAAFNSGVMIHAQNPLSMTRDQLWPVSLEGQFLVLGTSAGRQTGNACTPGTDVVLDGKLTKAHIIDSKAKLPPVDEWVKFEIEVRGHESVVHRVNGVEVLRYTQPQLDPTDADAQRLLAAGASRQLSFGHIALQAEGHPVWFRNIEILPLTP